MTNLEFLTRKIEHGFHVLGQVEWTKIPNASGFQLTHIADREKSPSSLDAYTRADDAREICTFAPDGTYRFSKAQTNLASGWILSVPNLTELLRALDLFYPAAIGLLNAQQHGTLHIEFLREKLNRQTGMYQYAKNISTEGAQYLTQNLCGPAHQCAKKILWQIDATTPLVPSIASEFDGIVAHEQHDSALPLVCREACNHFVAECRKIARREFQQAEREKTE